MVPDRAPPVTKKLSQSTLHKIFLAMLGVVFFLYVALMVCMIHKHFGDFEGGESNWGPPAVSQSDKVLKDHIQNLRQKLHDDVPERQRKVRIPVAARPTTKGSGKKPLKEPMDVTIGAGAHFRGASKDLEALDIHADEIFAKKDKLPFVPVEAEAEKVEQMSQQQQNTTTKQDAKLDSNPKSGNVNSQDEESRVLKAYLEPVHVEDWGKKPLPVRNITSEQLTVIEYPRMTSCRRLPELFPIDDYPDADPFLPWIHDVFPTDDGKYIQFVAQNKRRCRTGTTLEETEILEKMQPQVALFQHVPIKRTISENQTRYKLTSHEEADSDGIATRFICKFHPSGQETLSVFNFHYDYAALRKKHRHTFSREGTKDNKSIHTSQLVFQCPVPEDLVEIVRSGKSVVDDRATMFLTLVPIRTPPRYGAPDEFLPPYYRNLGTVTSFNVTEEWDETHVLPLIEDSGRWENIPICLPTWKAYPEVTAPPPPSVGETKLLAPKDVLNSPTNTKKHRLIASTWASMSYGTRGERFKVTDGGRRLDEWIRFHLIVGVDHIFIYDNSHGVSSLKPITDQFPDEVTRIPWPATICNNNRSFADSPGERSSQYAAESSWRLRFGPHTDWIASMDVDEYIIPVGEFSSLKPFLDSLDKNGTKIVSFGSWRAWPRRDLIVPPVPIINKTICDQPHPCFELKVPSNRSILQTYNCDRQIVKTEHMPAEKQIYRSDYVLQHYVHYSTVTRLSQMNAEDTVAADMKFGRMAPDPLSRFADEVSEVTMLHTKAVATQDTAGWDSRCKGEKSGSCRIGVPFPDADLSSNITKDDKGWLYNCYVNQKVEDHWVPLLDNELRRSKLHLELE